MTDEPQEVQDNIEEPPAVLEEIILDVEGVHQYDRTEFERLFKLMEKFDASDLHLKAGATPIFRVHGKIHRMKGEKLLGDDVRKLAYSIMTEDQRARFALNNVHDFAYSAPGIGRFRVNAYAQRGTVSIAARRVKTRIPTFEELNLPPVLNRIAAAQAGLVIVGGVTGSGKSTTLAAILDLVNKTRACHILSIEDPIEYLHMDAKAFVNQREVGIDVENYNTALKYAVRQDPDVILIGEMRDAESFDTALMAAETGHLVLGSIHTSGAPQTIGRILDLFGADRHPAIRQLLRFNFVAIVCQKLLRGKQEQYPRVPCVEVMMSTPVTRKLIGEAEDVKLSDAIRAGKADGMQDFNTSLVDLIHKDLISRDEAFKSSPNPEALKMNLKGIYLDQDRKIIG
ncbi:MAG: PilT/PilU family type 4a pilus ATPase [Planctomycetota bacterium]